MKEGRLGLRLDTKLLQRMKAYARRRNTSISALVEAFFKELTAADDREQSVIETVDAEQV